MQHKLQHFVAAKWNIPIITLEFPLDCSFTLNHFAEVIHSYFKKLMFANVSCFHPYLIFVDNDGSLPIEWSQRKISAKIGSSLASICIYIEDKDGSDWQLQAPIKY